MPSLHFEQILPVPLETAFAFHQDPYNLIKITPANLGLHVTNPEPVIMRPGAVITYQIKWMGLPLSWRTVITAYDPPYGFTDVQTKGPYRKWEHTHTFVREGESTRIIDDLEYQLPLGALGHLVAGSLIRQQLVQIFQYRSKRLDEIFRST